MNPQTPSASPLIDVLQPTLAVQITDWLAAEIESERMAPGDRINEYQLAQRLGISRGPLREALRMLETRGLVTITPRKGAVVTQLNVEEVLQLFDIRIALVGLAARLCADKRSEEQVARLNAHYEALQKAVTDKAAYYEVSRATAREIADGCGNKLLADMINSFAPRIERYGRLGLLTEERRRQSLIDWRQFLDAIAAGEADRSEQLQRRLATENRNEVLQVLKQREQLNWKAHTLT